MKAQTSQTSQLSLHHHHAEGLEIAASAQELAGGE
jgi:hypothetical protein